ncbi:Sperm flagellar protein 2 [Fukomys damarensis]|uniref:Sperm flagellar protein 2 n=1 Tax=Fukomys damarensis TaxID=885580 RepID=A0A091E216_FUKDA|nr:Sperm flagellar protein 2 [Fukomys damarensis]
MTGFQQMSFPLGANASPSGGIQFDKNMAQIIMTEKYGAATKLLYKVFIALQKKKKSGLTGVQIPITQPLASLTFQNMKIVASQHDKTMAKIQAAIIEISKLASNHTLKALEAPKMMKRQQEAVDVACGIMKFEALINKGLLCKTKYIHWIQQTI